MLMVRWARNEELRLERIRLLREMVDRDARERKEKVEKAGTNRK